MLKCYTRLIKTLANACQWGCEGLLTTESIFEKFMKILILSMHYDFASFAFQFSLVFIMMTKNWTILQSLISSPNQKFYIYSGCNSIFKSYVYYIQSFCSQSGVLNRLFRLRSKCFSLVHVSLKLVRSYKNIVNYASGVSLYLYLA